MTALLTRLAGLVGQPLPLAAEPALDESLALAGRLVAGLMGVKRLRHSQASAQLAASLAPAYGLAPGRLRLVGLLHDCCKELPLSLQSELAARCPIRVALSSLGHERYLHGPAAAVLLAEQGICRDRSSLQAIAWHTLGDPAMDSTALVIYLADKLDTSRGDWASDLRQAWLDGGFPGEAGLLRLTSLVLERLMAWLEQSGHPVAESTPALYNAMQRRLTVLSFSPTGQLA
ncbi:MAG: hypothetical protein A2087_14350 [Spirochaetes bacterium GWD1_61_31]|nr:MAG: hypothetical protein A2Y37_04240 [Spirochaetes bacterium GWB1_60_80]OHD30586.1 MAG: hypothetical protein A2004_05630 [Spirochaetes bacterium GWC1_61_12]OHD34855.1 MAG: hypothetical protein A2087_14350 [Spirochaetes bacterium GWD1_61_31]OHD46701.1 MAG: hypothetical protein A2Y35_11175 [Spirochaetes bacterium GWE1_60_18]OHD60329.1 MAG: hypothetical protein A2Y32_14740 [Spirochaetes bacterium GWF1_60_12]HAP44229.1 hypothetical protein [Spirochaetaceae bacterium]